MKQILLITISLVVSQLSLFAQSNFFDWDTIPDQDNEITINEITANELNLKIINSPGIVKCQIEQGDSIKTFDSVAPYIKAGDTLIVKINKMVDESFAKLKNPNNTTPFSVKLITDKDDIKKFRYKYDIKSDNNKNGINPYEKPGPVDPTKIPIPYFAYNNSANIEKRNNRHRVLIIDANPNPSEKANNSLYQLKRNSLHAKNSLFVNSNISVFIGNYSFNRVKELSVNIDGIDYSYSRDISYLMNIGSVKDSSKGIDKQWEPANRESTETENGNGQLNNYLKGIVEHLDLIKYVNLNDYRAFREYLDTLNKACQNNNLTDSAGKNLNKINYWQPEYVSLTPISLLVPDKDEVEVSLMIEKKGKEQINQPIGSYKTIGGSATNLSTSLFVTNLVNNKIYTDSLNIAVNDTLSKNELRALIKDNKYSIGLGVNVETSFRTGFWLRPMVNVGMFVPFEEDVSPYLALGIGCAIVMKKVKLSIGFGAAGGFVNEINSKYKDKDLSLYPNYAEDLYEKVPQMGWQINFGVSFNIN